MKTKNIILVISIVASLVSCKKVLEVDNIMYIPNDQAITSAHDLENVMVGAYDGLQSGNVLGGNLVVYSELYGDDTKVNESKLYDFGTKEIYNRSTTVQLNSLRSMWGDSYNTINRVNLIIDAIDGGTISGEYFESVKDKLKGEALFIRAVVHFEILRFWSEAYNINAQGGNTQPGIPYRTTPTKDGFEDLSMARNTVEECYNLIINDLATAESLLTSAGALASQDYNGEDENLPMYGRASAMAAAGYLARVYFYKGDYSNASIVAERVINSGKYSLDASVTDAFRLSGDKTTSEVIFQLVNIETDQSNAVRYNFSTSDGSAPLFMGVISLKDLFPTDDQRRTKFISYNMFRQEVYAAKYLASSPEFNMVLLRLAEMYLIAGESFYELGDTRAYDMLREIQHRAFGIDYNPSITWDDLGDVIKKERRKELIFEGDRYHNLRRMQQPVRDSIPWNDPSLLFKIPQEEMSGNPLMEQNP